MKETPRDIVTMELLTFEELCGSSLWYKKQKRKRKKLDRFQFFVQFGSSRSEFSVKTFQFLANWHASVSVVQVSKTSIISREEVKSLECIFLPSSICHGKSAELFCANGEPLVGILRLLNFINVAQKKPKTMTAHLSLWLLLGSNLNPLQSNFTVAFYSQFVALVLFPIRFYNILLIRNIFPLMEKTSVHTWIYTTQKKCWEVVFLPLP